MSRYKRRPEEEGENILWSTLSPPSHLSSEEINNLHLEPRKGGYLRTAVGIDQGTHARKALIEPDRGQTELPQSRQLGRPRAKGSIVVDWSQGDAKHIED